MHTITTIVLDIAKSAFQVHGVDADGQVVVRRQLKRGYVLAFFQKLPPCLVAIAARGGTSQPGLRSCRSRTRAAARSDRYRRSLFTTGATAVSQGRCLVPWILA
jgi:hypothetical protein